MDNKKVAGELVKLAKSLVSKMDKEDMDSADLGELVEELRGQEKLNRNNMKALERVVKAIGYLNLEAFFSDNEGAVETLIGWIEDVDSKEWKDSVKDQLEYSGKE